MKPPLTDKEIREEAIRFVAEQKAIADKKQEAAARREDFFDRRKPGKQRDT